MAGAAVVSGGCGGGTPKASRAAATGRASVTTRSSPSRPPIQKSVDQHRAQQAVRSRDRNLGYKVLSVNCQNNGRRRFDCSVNGAQLWQAVVTSSGSIHLRLLGSE